MHGRQGGKDDDTTLTLRAPRSVVASVLALVAHTLVVGLLTLLPEREKPPQPISITLQQSSPPPPPATSPSPSLSPPPPSSKQRSPKRAPRTSPVVPELPPSPPKDRAQLPIVEKAPTPAPPPAREQTWEERVRDSLATPAPKIPTGVLAPSLATLDRVAASDARLFDEKTEQRLQEDFGTFFRRGIEALRGQWHPDEVLSRGDPRDASKLCGKQTRTTYAVAVIDRSGNVVDVDMRRSSECPQLDEEAIAAFLRVAQFPHPPSGLFVDSDGVQVATARYPVRFIVSFDGGLRLDWR